MSTSPIVVGFAARLREAMLAAGFYSTRSKSGVCIQHLTTITGHSRQICRKYLEGMALPEPHVLLKLASSLQVNAGWLLFGEEPKPVDEDKLVIRKTLLHHVLAHQHRADTHSSSTPEFLIHLMHEMSQLSGDDSQLKKIIDLAIQSH